MVVVCCLLWSWCNYVVVMCCLLRSKGYYVVVMFCLPWFGVINHNKQQITTT